MPLGSNSGSNHFNQAIVPFRRTEIEPIVRGQCPYSRFLPSEQYVVKARRRIEASEAPRG